MGNPFNACEVSCRIRARNKPGRTRTAQTDSLQARLHPKAAQLPKNGFSAPARDDRWFKSAAGLGVRN